MQQDRRAPVLNLLLRLNLSYQGTKLQNPLAPKIRHGSVKPRSEAWDLQPIGGIGTRVCRIRYQ